MSEGRHTTTAAPRSLPELRRDLLLAEARGDEHRIRELQAEIRVAADQATHLEGGKRGV